MGTDPTPGLVWFISRTSVVDQRVGCQRQGFRANTCDTALPRLFGTGTVITCLACWDAVRTRVLVDIVKHDEVAFRESRWVVCLCSHGEGDTLSRVLTTEEKVERWEVPCGILVTSFLSHIYFLDFKVSASVLSWQSSSVCIDLVWCEHGITHDNLVRLGRRSHDAIKNAHHLFRKIDCTSGDCLIVTGYSYTVISPNSILTVQAYPRAILLKSRDKETEHVVFGNSASVACAAPRGSTVVVCGFGSWRQDCASSQVQQGTRLACG